MNKHLSLICFISVQFSLVRFSSIQFSSVHSHFDSKPSLLGGTTFRPDLVVFSMVDGGAFGSGTGAAVGGLLIGEGDF